MHRMNTQERLYAVRGAVCCRNEDASIGEFVPELYRRLLKSNSIDEARIVSVIFTVTADLTRMNPATALRKAGLAESAPLFAALEPAIEGSLPGVVRVLITYYGSSEPIPVYFNGAEALRPDLFPRTGPKAD